MARHPSFQIGREYFRKGDMSNPNKKDSIAYKEHQAGFDYEYFLNLNNTTTNSTFATQYNRG